MLSVGARVFASGPSQGGAWRRGEGAPAGTPRSVDAGFAAAHATSSSAAASARPPMVLQRRASLSGRGLGATAAGRRRGSVSGSSVSSMPMSMTMPVGTGPIPIAASPSNTPLLMTADPQQLQSLQIQRGGYSAMFGTAPVQEVVPTPAAAVRGSGAGRGGSAPMQLAGSSATGTVVSSASMPGQWRPNPGSRPPSAPLSMTVEANAFPPPPVPAGHMAGGGARGGGADYGVATTRTLTPPHPQTLSSTPSAVAATHSRAAAPSNGAGGASADAGASAAGGVVDAVPGMRRVLLALRRSGALSHNRLDMLRDTFASADTVSYPLCVFVCRCVQ